MADSEHRATDDEERGVLQPAPSGGVPTPPEADGRSLGEAIVRSGETPARILDRLGTGDPLQLVELCAQQQRARMFLIDVERLFERSILRADDVAADDDFGYAVAVDGTTVLVGAPYHDAPGKANAGAVYVFDQDQGGAGAWGQVAKLTAGDLEDYDRLGWSVSLSGDTAAVGAPYRECGMFCSGGGAAYVFERDLGGANAWGQAARLINAIDGPNAAVNFTASPQLPAPPRSR
jgi:hypothetical protein